MAELRINAKWMAAAAGEPDIRATAALLDLRIDDLSLTKNQDIWAETVRDDVFVSAYPLAIWFASSWWRLMHEPLPTGQPGHDWRMTHELGAANHGFVWPRVIFVPDGEVVHVWAGASMTPDQSVQYLQALEVPKPVPLASFQQSVHDFVQRVVSRLDARQLADTPLAQLWALLQEDLSDPEALRRRKLEAELGFDPEECPEPLLDATLQWESQVGAVALSELAPALSASGRDQLASLAQLAHAPGIMGSPTVSPDSIEHLEHGAPWERAVHDARALRRAMGKPSEPVTQRDLHQLLGLSSASLAHMSAPGVRSPVAVAIPTKGQEFKFVARRSNPLGQRFELTRFLAEYLRPATDRQRWMASTDLGTSRQKYQRAFAAEFLCPIEALTSFLNGDYSTYAREEAAEHFEVSEWTVTSLLQNNGYLHQAGPGSLPYSMAA